MRLVKQFHTCRGAFTELNTDVGACETAFKVHQEERHYKGSVNSADVFNYLGMTMLAAFSFADGEINEKLNRQSGFHLRNKLSSTYSGDKRLHGCVEVEILTVAHCWDLYLGSS